MTYTSKEAADLARHYSMNYTQGSDGRNTFEILAGTLEGRMTKGVDG